MELKRLDIIAKGRELEAAVKSGMDEFSFPHKKSPISCKRAIMFEQKGPQKSTTARYYKIENTRFHPEMAQIVSRRQIWYC